MKSITCRFRKDNILKWGKNGKNQAKPGAGGPAACAPPARACGTALQHSAGKEGPGGGAFCRRTKQRPEREARAAGGRPFARQPADLPAAWCAPLPPPAPHGHALCAPVLLRLAYPMRLCLCFLPGGCPVCGCPLCTCAACLAWVYPFAALCICGPARPHMPCAPVAAHMLCRGRALCRARRALRQGAVFVILNTLHARGTKRAAE